MPAQNDGRGRPSQRKAGKGSTLTLVKGAKKVAKKKTAAKPPKAVAEFTRADEVEQIAKAMISAGKYEGLDHLKRARIRYLFTSQPMIGRVGVTKSFKYPPHYRESTAWDFGGIVSKPQWSTLTEIRRESVVYGMLLAMGVSSLGKFTIKPPDFEDYYLRVRHFGLDEPRFKMIEEQLGLWTVEHLDAPGKKRAASS